MTPENMPMPVEVKEKPTAHPSMQSADCIAATADQLAGAQPGRSKSL